MWRVVMVLASAALLTTLAVVTADIIQHDQHGGPLLRSSFAWWVMAGPGTMSAVQGFLEQAFGPAIWDPVILTILGIPAALVLAIKTTFLFLMAIAVRDS